MNKLQRASLLVGMSTSVLICSLFLLPLFAHQYPIPCLAIFTFDISLLLPIFLRGCFKKSKKDQ